MCNNTVPFALGRGPRGAKGRCMRAPTVAALSSPAYTCMYTIVSAITSAVMSARTEQSDTPVRLRPGPLSRSRPTWSTAQTCSIYASTTRGRCAHQLFSARPHHQQQESSDSHDSLSLSRSLSFTLHSSLARSLSHPPAYPSYCYVNRSHFEQPLHFSHLRHL